MPISETIISLIPSPLRSPAATRTGEPRFLDGAQILAIRNAFGINQSYSAFHRFSEHDIRVMSVTLRTRIFAVTGTASVLFTKKLVVMARCSSGVSITSTSSEVLPKGIQKEGQSAEGEQSTSDSCILF